MVCLWTSSLRQGLLRKGHLRTDLYLWWSISRQPPTLGRFTSQGSTIKVVYLREVALGLSI